MDLYHTFSEYFGFLSEVTMDNVVQSAVDLPSHPLVQAVAKATINYDRTKIHTIDMVNMEQFDKDLAAGIITNN